MKHGHFDGNSHASTTERIVVLLLRLAALLVFPAFGAVFLPTSWMARVHESLGLGAFPASSLVEYLTRSIALLYGFHGVLLWVVSTDVRRFRPLVVYLATMDVVFGAGVLTIDLKAGMPGQWTALEGPPLIGFGLLLFALLRRVPRVTSRPADGARRAAASAPETG